MKALRKPLSLFMAMLMCLGIFAGTGTTAFAAGETMTTYMVEFPRASDPNKAGWGHSAMNFLGGWSTGENNGFTIHTQDSFNGKVIYCIEPGVSVHSGDQFTGRGEDFWDDYPSDLNPTIPPDTIKEYIGRIMTYGWQGNASTSWMTDDPEDASKMAGAIATQLLVWETVVGERDSQFNHVDANAQGKNNIAEYACSFCGYHMDIVPTNIILRRIYFMQTENKKGFQVKDLIVTALLSLCALVIYIICAFLSFSPYTMLVVSPLWSLLAAITYFLVAAKTKKPWALFIFCAVTGIYGFYPPMIICCIIAGIISALIAWKTGCTNGKTLTFSYIIYMVLAAFSGTYIPFLFFSNQTLEQYAGMFGESYLGILQTLVSPVTAIIMLVVVAICAFVGALIAKKLLKKHFKKAGMV